LAALRSPRSAITSTKAAYVYVKPADGQVGVRTAAGLTWSTHPANRAAGDGHRDRLADTIVPGHGPVTHDKTYVLLVRDLMESAVLRSAARTSVVA